jgi:hypothetical protein
MLPAAAVLSPEWVSTIKLCNHTTPPETKITYIGWGWIGNTYPSVLMEAPARIITRVEAQPWFNTSLTDVNVLTRGEGNSSVCNVSLNLCFWNDNTLISNQS